MINKTLMEDHTPTSKSLIDNQEHSQDEVGLHPRDGDADEEGLHEEDVGERTCLQRWFGPIRSGSLRGSTVAMASITFGGGCLAFPFAVAKTGPIIGLLFFIVIGACSYYTLKCLLDDGVKAKIMDYNELLEHAVGKKAVIFSDINNIIMVIGIIMSYQLTVYEFALQLGKLYFGIDPEDKTNKLILMTTCAIFFQIPLSLLKNISTLQYASIVGTIALIYSIFVIVCEAPFYFENYIDEGNTINLFPRISLDYLKTFSTFMFGFASHNGIYQVFTELKRPSVNRYYKILWRSFVIEVILYLAIAYGGYFSTFDKTLDVFLKRPDLPGFNDIFIQIAKITLFICLHCTMAINYNIMRMSFKSMFFNNKDIPFLKDASIVVITYILSNLMVFYLSDVTDILGIIGGFCTIVICFINPILIHIKLSGKPNTDRQNIMAWGIMIFLTVFGVAATIRTLVGAFLPKDKI